MKRINLFLDETEIEYLKRLPGTLTEHIRRAIYEYLQKLSTQNVSASQSRKEDKNGTTNN